LLRLTGGLHPTGSGATRQAPTPPVHVGFSPPGACLTWALRGLRFTRAPLTNPAVGGRTDLQQRRVYNGKRLPWELRDGSSHASTVITIQACWILWARIVFRNATRPRIATRQGSRGRSVHRWTRPKNRRSERKSPALCTSKCPSLDTASHYFPPRLDGHTLMGPNHHTVTTPGKS
jgi:hypothetical protein